MEKLRRVFRLAKILLSRPTYIKDYIASLNLAPTAVTLAVGLFTTVEDCDLFDTDFKGKNQFPIEDLGAFKAHKFDLLNITLESLELNILKNGVKIAFEETFLCSLNNYQVSIIQDHIKHNPKSVKHIFESFKENPQKNIMQYVL